MSSGVVACGGDPDTGEPPGQPAGSDTAEGSGSESPAPETYLPVPSGVELTPQGTELPLRDSAVVAWEPRQDLVGVLDVTVKRVELTTFAASFQGWQLDATARRSTPYFVRASVENVGASSLGGRAVPLYAVGDADILVQASRFKARFNPCPGSGILPGIFGPGDTAELCMVYLVPDGGEMGAVSFRPTQEFDPITWTGRIKRPGGTGERGPRQPEPTD